MCKILVLEYNSLFIYLKLKIFLYHNLQENQLQELKLLVPALLNGGVLLVELFGKLKHRGRLYDKGFVSHTYSITLSHKINVVWTLLSNTFSYVHSSI